MLGLTKEEVSKSKKGLKRNAAVIRLANHSSYSNISSSVDMESLDSFIMDDDSLIPNRSHSIRTNDSNQSGSATIDRSLSARSKRQQKDRLLLHGVKQFNLDPVKGLKLLEERGFLEMTPESVAQFLFRQERLSKKQIGTFLGGHQDFNKEVLSIYVKLHQFSHLLLVQALRQFLWSFRREPCFDHLMDGKVLDEDEKSEIDEFFSFSSEGEKRVGQINGPYLSLPCD